MCLNITILCLVFPKDIKIHYNYYGQEFNFCSSVNWYIKNPRGEEQSNYYLQPFGFDVWRSIIFFIIVGSIIIIIIQRLFENIVHKTNISPIAEYLFIGFESFCNQIGSQEFKNSSFRVACFSFRFLALFIIPSYSAVIISFIAVRIPHIPFQNMDEFFKDGTYKLASQNGNFFNLDLEVNFYFFSIWKILFN